MVDMSEMFMTNFEEEFLKRRDFKESRVVQRRLVMNRNEVI